MRTAPRSPGLPVLGQLSRIGRVVLVRTVVLSFAAMDLFVDECVG